MVTKSILESLELENGTDVTIQASMRDRVTISFDGIATSAQHTMTVAEASELAKLLNIVVEETN